MNATSRTRFLTRTAAVCFAGALALAGCGNAQEEKAAEVQPSAPATATIPGASDGGASDSSRAPAESSSPSEEGASSEASDGQEGGAASGTAGASDAGGAGGESGQKAPMGMPVANAEQPTIFGIVSLQDLEAVQDAEFPVKPEAVAESLTQFGEAFGVKDAKCEGAVAGPGQGQGVKCSFTDGRGRQREAYSNGVYGPDMDPSLLITFDKPVKVEGGELFKNENSIVYLAGAGGEFGVGAPADKEQVEGLMKKVSADHHLGWKSVTCDGPVSADTPTKNTTVCHATVGGTTIDVPVFGGHIATAEDNGLFFVYDITALNP